MVITLDIELPSDDDLDDDSVFGGRIDAYEAYWLYVDGTRYVGPALEQSEATKEDTGQSPLARHYKHFYEKKEEYKQRCSNLPGNLPEYKEHFNEPRGDVRKIPEQKLSDLGLGEEDDDPIWLPPEYELPDVWENDLNKLSKSELKEFVRRLQDENEELIQERDEFREHLEQVRQSLSSYFDTTDDADIHSTSNVCSSCGKSFASQDAINRHKPHCEGRSNSSQQEGDIAQKELTRLAEVLPEFLESQSKESIKSGSPGEDLENLNYLLQGSL